MVGLLGFPRDTYFTPEVGEFAIGAPGVAAVVGAGVAAVVVGAAIAVVTVVTLVVVGTVVVASVVAGVVVSFVVGAVVIGRGLRVAGEGLVVGIGFGVGLVVASIGLGPNKYAIKSTCI